VAIVCEEAYGGARVTDGLSPWAEVPWVVSGVDEEFEARNAVRSASDTLYDLYGDSSLFLPRASITCSGQQGEWFFVTVRYTGVQAEGDTRFEFDIGGTTERRMRALATTAYAPSGLTAPDVYGLIGNHKDGVEGVDVVAPAFRFSRRVWLSDSMVSASYRSTVSAIVGTVNNDTFEGFAAGTVLLEGVQGAQRSTGDYELLFRFVYSPNATGLTVGSITGVKKGGHEYLWVKSKQTVDDNAMVWTPLAVYVQQVYAAADFDGLELPSEAI
jgi:hypothetical protein